MKKFSYEGGFKNNWFAVMERIGGNWRPGKTLFNPIHIGKEGIYSNSKVNVIVIKKNKSKDKTTLQRLWCATNNVEKHKSQKGVFTFEVK